MEKITSNTSFSYLLWMMVENIIKTHPENHDKILLTINRYLYYRYADEN